MRTDFDPDAVRGDLIREAVTLATHGALYGFGYLRSRHRPKRAESIRTTVFVHGLLANRASFFPMQGYLSLLGHKRQYSFNYRFERSIEEMALALKRRLDRKIKGGRIDLVCHSMGGLIARYYVQALGGHRRVDRLVTIATPHYGSHSSAYIPLSLLSQFKPGGPFLEHLNELPPPVGVRCTSIAARKDLVVLPWDSGHAPFGERHVIDELGHLDVLFSPRVCNLVNEALGSAVDEPLQDARVAGG